jgi:hypothetical protein
LLILDYFAESSLCHEDIRVLTGYIYGTSIEELLLCSGSGGPGKGECWQIDPEVWRSRPVEHIVRQWNGERVEVAGFRRRSGLLGFEMRLLDRTPSAAFCERFRGPLEPSPREDDYDDAWQYGRFRQWLADGTELRMHAYKAIVGYFPPGWLNEAVPERTVSLGVSGSWSGRDIEVLVALSRAHFVYWLRDGRLFSWRQGELLEISDGRGLPGDYVIGGDGSLYYSLDQDDALLEGPKNVVLRLTPDLKVSREWVSATHSVVGMSWKVGTDGATGLALQVEWNPTKSEILVCPDGRLVEASAVDYRCSGKPRLEHGSDG